jgi:hypothetical protein
MPTGIGKGHLSESRKDLVNKQCTAMRRTVIVIGLQSKIRPETGRSAFYHGRLNYSPVGGVARLDRR